MGNLVTLFPEEFLANGQDVITILLQQGHRELKWIVKAFEKARGILDEYRLLWLQVARKIKPNEEFKKKFASLSPEQRHTLYDAAFTYNNSFLYETPDIPIVPDQYSINLMWINKNKMPADQEFLFGDGATPEKRQSDFHKRFIEPVSKWAKANPGSPINIWVDGAMATKEAIGRSQEALEDELRGTRHGNIQFRDVRSMEVVKQNPAAFSEEIFFDFRGDLLGAIAVDYTLRRQETQFAVYVDPATKPLTRNNSSIKELLIT